MDLLELQPLLPEDDRRDERKSAPDEERLSGESWASTSKRFWFGFEGWFGTRATEEFVLA